MTVFSQFLNKAYFEIKKVFINLWIISFCCKDRFQNEKNFFKVRIIKSLVIGIFQYLLLGGSYLKDRKKCLSKSLKYNVIYREIN